MDIIKTVDLSKQYPKCLANDSVNIAVKQGLITAIVGENGAGKTTLMNMLYGLVSPTSGQILVDGKPVKFASPLDAMACGIGMVHQHFKLVPSLTVLENIMLGTEIKNTFHYGKIKFRLPFIDKKAEYSRVFEIIKRFKFGISPNDVVNKLSIGQQQRVEILKMLYRNVRILIFDEPTAVLTPQEVDEFLLNLKKLKGQGKTIILITHKLQEVMNASDEVIVLRGGKVIAAMPTSRTSPSELADVMVGRKVLLRVNKNYQSFEENKIVYRVDHLSANDENGGKILDDITFTIKKGEVLGIAGVEGNGQSELMKALTGLMETSTGNIELNNANITNFKPKQLRKLGIAMIPEDRYAQGLCRQMTISENLIAGHQGDRKFCRMGILDNREISKNLDGKIRKFDIRGNKYGMISELSGGNAQKVIIAREFSSNPKILIASQPTRGVDVGSIEFIHNKILDLSAGGKAVLIISSELSEIMSLSDQILVMSKGRVIGPIPGKNADIRNIGRMMAGVAD